MHFAYTLNQFNTVIYGMENITKEEIDQIAKRALTGYLVVQDGLGEIPHNYGKLDWNISVCNNSDRTQLLLQSLNMIQLLSKAYLNSGEKAYLILAINFFNDWYDFQANFEKSQYNAYIWNDHAVALRTENIIYLMLLLDKENLLDCNMYNKLYDVLKCQGKWLNNNENYFWNCNHGIYEDRALICLAKLWETDEAKKWLKNAKIRLLSQKKFAFTDEMVHVENSPEYHLVVLDLFMRIAVFLKQFDDSYGEELYQAIKVSEEFLSWMIKPNGYLAEVGDTERKTLFLPEDVVNCYKKKSVKTDCESKTEWNQVYPKSGYAFWRREVEKDNPRADSWFMFKSGYHSRVHKHADDLSILWSVGGYDILIDPGKLGYTLGEARVDYLHSALAHNTVVVDEKTYSITNERTHLTGILEFDTSGAIQYVRGFNDSYSGVHIDRAIYYWANMLIIHDEIQSADIHTYSQMFHISEQIKLIQQSDIEIIGETINGDYIVQIKQILNVNGTYLYSGSVQQDKKYGYRSSKMGEIIDCTTCRFEKSGSNVEFVTAITVEHKKNIKNDLSGITINGRNLIVSPSINIQLKKRERPNLLSVKCKIDTKSSDIILLNEQVSNIKEYRWELWDMKWGKKIREKTTLKRYCKFERDFYVDVYVKLVATTIQNQTIKGIVFILKYIALDKRHEIALAKKWNNLLVEGLQMEWYSEDSARFTVLYDYKWNSKINWHIYRNGGHYYHQFIVNRGYFEYQFKYPGRYTVMFFIESPDGEKEFWNFPEFEYRGKL